ncbi:hypothetical protein EDI_101630 [Entamoeba dispar SAW760]|uniref:F-box domain-containing protein n=1 Tax=Entamoeba dispar (strain ATCC PRA-260 / SAW760) TaxID=370354 RepID=B0EE07_ENTDS|nr:uncharacterized protein EDI_101630 [Entamoeba dispar SAW760]EDR27242.1 hypothetical protein EDI_101630 [Entamoeba dispar SAW760]|eukprot:EDR27242.1 hypothetical protein EDI_101630 [Entamoeba dispar SAW760]
MISDSNIQTIFRYLPPQYYLSFIAINKRYQKVIEEKGDLMIINKTMLKMKKVNTLTIYGDYENETLPNSCNELILLGNFKSFQVSKLIQKYNLKKLILNGIECNTMAEFKHINQLLGLQTSLTKLQYSFPPTDPSLLYLTSLQHLQSLHVRLIPRIIPIITKFQSLQSLTINFGAQSIVKITEDNNGINPFNSLSVLLGLTSMKIIADSIKQLNSLSELTSIKNLHILDLLEVNISNAPKLIFLTKLRHLKTVFLRVKSSITSPLDLATYFKMPSIFKLSISSFNHDFEAFKSFEPIEKISKHCSGEIDSMTFWRNTSQLDKVLPLINSMCIVKSLSITSCPNISNIALNSFELESLRSLTISQCLKIKSFDFLNKCSVLTSLELTKIPFDQLSILQSLSTLSLMSLSIGMIKEFDVSILSSFHSLLSLSLNTIPCLKNLEKTPQSIMRLTIENCNDFCLCDICHLPQLHEVILNSIPSSNSLVFVSSLNSLTRLDIIALKDCKFGNNELFGITGSNSLRILVVKDIPTFTIDVMNIINEALPNLRIIA